LNCNSNKVTFSGLTFEATSEMQCLVMIHSGCVAFNNCVLDGANCARNTLIVLSKAKVEIDNCDVRNERGEGIISRKGSVIINKDVVNTNSKTNTRDGMDSMEVEKELSPSAPELTTD